MSVRSILILTTCQLISATGAICCVRLGGIIRSDLACGEALATLPPSVIVISVAATTVPAPLPMCTIGRKHGSSLAITSTAVAALLAALESVGGHPTGRAMSFVLPGAIGAAHGRSMRPLCVPRIE